MPAANIAGWSIGGAPLVPTAGLRLAPAPPAPAACGRQTPRHSVTQCDTVRHSAVQCGTVRYSVGQCGTTDDQRRRPRAPTPND
eukprot:2769806-Pyramimonas_sp.AAC.1